MERNIYFAALCWLLVKFCQASPKLTSEEIEDATTHHNFLRSQVDPPAANMEYMTWNEELAIMAERWAEECIWEHGQVDDIERPYPSIGQNLYLAIGISEDRVFNMTGVVQAWYNEVNFYDWDTKVCSGPTCGHYKQVTWAKSSEVGCGTHFCPVISDYSNITYPNSRIIVCNYKSSLVVGNPNPYISGPPCTQCSSGSGQCYSNLCRSCLDHDEVCECNLECFNCGNLNESNCRCSCQDGWMGHDCGEECADQHAWCNDNTKWPPSVCPLNDAIPVYCPLMCGVCQEAPLEPIGCGLSEIPVTARECTNRDNMTLGSCQFDAYMNVSSCLCECGGDINENGYCIKKSTEKEFGVTIYISQLTKSQWSDIKSTFIGAVVLAVNLNCNSNLLKKQCCLLDVPTTDFQMYSEENGIIFPFGYPKEDSEDLVITILALTCCQAARYRRQLENGEDLIETPRKNSQDTNEMMNDKNMQSSSRKRVARSSTENNDYYLDKTILYEAIKEYSDIIEDKVEIKITGISMEEGVIEKISSSSYAATCYYCSIIQLTICVFFTFYLYL